MNRVEVGVIILSVLGAMVAVLMLGCVDPKTPDTAMLAEAAAHQAELLDCVSKGKTAKQYAVYTACADAVDARYGIVATDSGTR